MFIKQWRLCLFLREQVTKSGKNAFKRECWLQILKKVQQGFTICLRKERVLAPCPGSLINPKFLVEDILN